MSILAIVSKAEFEKSVATPKVGELWKTSVYASQSSALERLNDGGDLYLVTARPNDRLWLVAILRRPKKSAKGWTASVNTVPITDATPVSKKLRFTTGKGIAFAPGKLGMTLQAPRQLTDDDVALLEALHAPIEAKARGQSLETLLDLDDAFAVTKFKGFPEHKHSPSNTVVRALDDVTTCGSLLLLAGCMLWAARRLAKVTDVRRCYQIAEAILCFQDSASYFGKRYPVLKRPKNDAERVIHTFGRALAIDRGAWVGKQFHPLPPGIASQAADAVTIVRTVLGETGKRPFEEWLAAVLERLRRFAGNPRMAKLKAKGASFDYDVEERFREEHVGPPLPPALLDLRFTPKVSALGPLYAEFLGSVDWQANPFLASPKELARLPFYQGTPYVPKPGAKYREVMRPAKTGERAAPKVENPYPFLASLDAMPKSKQAQALTAYRAKRKLPVHFGPAELELEHAFSLMLGRQVAAETGLYVGRLLISSMDVIGDLDIVVRDKQARPPSLRSFEPEIDVGDEGEEARDLLLEVVKAPVLDRRRAEDGDFVVITSDRGLVGRVTRTELRRIAELLGRRVSRVSLFAPSDGSLFDALRFMVQQEQKSWGMSNILDLADLEVVSVDPRLEAALEAVENRALADDLAVFCDRDGRSARAWRWKGHSYEDKTRGVRFDFIAGVYDGEGVGMDFDVYRVTPSKRRA